VEKCRLDARAIISEIFFRREGFQFGIRATRVRLGKGEFLIKNIIFIVCLRMLLVYIVTKSLLVAKFIRILKFGETRRSFKNHVDIT